MRGTDYTYMFVFHPCDIIHMIILCKEWPQVCQHSGIVNGKQWVWMPGREWNCREWMYIRVRGRREHSMHSWNAWCLFVCVELEKLCMCAWVVAIYLCWSTATLCCLFPGCGAFPASVLFLLFLFFLFFFLLLLLSPDWLYPFILFFLSLLGFFPLKTLDRSTPITPITWEDHLFCCCCCFGRLKTPLAPQMTLSTCTDPMMMDRLLIVISVNLPLTHSEYNAADGALYCTLLYYIWNIN